jgi:hypothetical protein
MADSPPRLLPDEPLPPYAFVPGQSPHPTSDPAGHSFGRAATPPAPLDPSRWRECRDYLHGLDLFNAGFYWEAHEAWEGLWHAAGRTGTTADFLKGLIKLAAAGVKHRAGKPAGVRSHACRAAELLRGVERDLLGLRIEEVTALADAVCRDGWPKEPPVLLPSIPSC